MRRLLAVWLLALVPAYAQTAGARAVAGMDRLPVYPKMSNDLAPVWQLSKGDAVRISLVLFGEEITWCAISRVGETKRLGYVSCEHLIPDRGEESAAPAPAIPSSPPAPPQPREPIRVREVPAAPPPAARVRELTPEAAAALVGSAREAGLLPDPSALAPKPPASVEPAAPLTEPPGPPETARNDLFARALRGTGIQAELRRYLETVNPVSFLEKTRLQHADADALRSAASQHLRRFVLGDEVLRLMAARFDAGETPRLQAYLERPSARKVEIADAEAAAPGAHRRLVAFAQALRRAPPSEARLELIHRIHAKMGLTNGEIELTLGTVRALALVMNPLLPDRLRFTAEQLETALGEVRAQYESVARNAAVVYLLFLNRELNDAELEETARFWESAAGHSLSAAVNVGLRAAGALTADQVARSLPPP